MGSTIGQISATGLSQGTRDLRSRTPPGMGIGDADMGFPSSMLAENRGLRETGAAEGGALADNAATKQGRRGVRLVKSILKLVA